MMRVDQLNELNIPIMLCNDRDEEKCSGRSPVMLGVCRNVGGKLDGQLDGVFLEKFLYVSILLSARYC